MVHNQHSHEQHADKPAPQATAPTGPQPDANAAGRRRTRIIVGVCVLVVLIGAGIGAYFATSGSSDTSDTATSQGVATSSSPTAVLVPLKQMVTSPPTVLATTAPVTRQTGPTVNKFDIGQAADGSRVIKYVVSNPGGIQIDLISYGARINAVRVPTARGMVDVVAGSDESNLTYFQTNTLGSINGRVCCAVPWSFSYQAIQYSFTTDVNNHDPLYTNGGVNGFYSKNYASYIDSQNSIHFLYNASGGSDGLAGAVWAHAVYRLTTDNQIIVDMTFSSDRTSPVDMCSSMAFNLVGAGSSSISGNILQLFTTQTAFTTFEPTAVHTDLQFQTPTEMYAAIQPAIPYINKYDYTFQAAGSTGGSRLMARVNNTANNITVSVLSDQAALRVHVPILNGVRGKNGANYTGMAYFVVQPQQVPVFQRDVSRLMKAANSQSNQQVTYQFTF